MFNIIFAINIFTSAAPKSKSMIFCRENVIHFRKHVIIIIFISQCANGERYSKIVYSMMASIASASRSKRKAASNSFVPGFYRALNEQCSAMSATTVVVRESECNLRLPANAT